MRVLVTNDDGVESAGLGALAAVAVRAGHEVVVAAPSRDYSGIGSAMTGAEVDGSIVAERVGVPGVDGVSGVGGAPGVGGVPGVGGASGVGGVAGYGVAATPALIVVMAIGGAFGPPPEAVLAGINAGPNTGRPVLHSGTVGAALTAGIRGRRAMAVSLAGNGSTGWHWPTAAAATERLLPLLERGEPETVLNVNVPNLPVDGIVGIRRATLAASGRVRATVREQDGGLLHLSWEYRDRDTDPASDRELVAKGYVTVTPLSSVGEPVGARLDRLPTAIGL